MTIEQTLAEINESLKTLVRIAQTSASAPQELGAAPEKATSRKNTKKDPEQTTATTDALGNPAGTVYFDIEKHNTVYAQRPGDAPPNIEPVVQVSAEVYSQKKAEYEKKISDVAAKSSTAATAPTATLEAGSASQSSETVSFKDVTAKLMEVSKMTKEGMPDFGRNHIISILKQFLPNAEKPTVPQLEPLNKNAEILAAATKILTGGTSVAAADPLFG